MNSSELSLFLGQPEQAKVLRHPAFVAGLIFGVSASPEIPMPEQWMPWTLSPDTAKLSGDMADKLADALMGQLRWQLDRMRKNEISLPKSCIWHKNKPQRANLENWLSGLVFAHQRCEPVWQSAWDNNAVLTSADRLTRCLKCFSLLADSDAALANSPLDKQSQLIENLPTLTEQVSQLLIDYVTLAGELAGTLPGQFEVSAKH